MGTYEIKKLIYYMLALLIHSHLFANESIFIPKIPEKAVVVDPKKYIDVNQIEQEKLIFRNIFDLHFKTWREEFDREIEYEDYKETKNDNSKFNENNQIKEEKLKKALNFLNKIVAQNPTQILLAEASFKLALFSYFSKKIDAVKAIEIISNGLKNFPKNEDNIKLFIRMNLFAGDLSLANEKYLECQKYFNAIKNLNIDPNFYREEIVRALVGLGDSYFSLFQFQQATIQYYKSKNLAEKGWMLNEEKLALLLGEIKMRLLWASFRSADYKSASEYALSFSREKSRYEKYFPLNVMNDVIRVSAIALYESKDIEFYKKLASDKVAGDFAKKMIIKSFYYFSSAGYGADVEMYAKAVEKNFFISREFPNFIRGRLIALEQINNMNKYYEISYYGSAFIAADSIWKSRFILSEQEEENRKEMISDLSLEAGNYFYNLGVQNNSRLDFLKSAEIYHARLTENFSFDLRGVLYQSYSQSLFMAGDYKLAWSASEESLKYPMESYLKKISWFQLVNISRKQSEDSSDTKTNEYLKYEKSVDGYVSNFPTDSQSRLSLYESAKRAELLGDFNNAQDRYERILSSPPLAFQEQSNEEKNKVSLSLANLYQKMGANQKDIIDSAGNLENYIKAFSVTDLAKKVVMIANRTLAIEYSNILKNAGKLKESAKFLEMWAKNYSDNPESVSIMILSIVEYADLQDWEHILNITKSIQNKRLSSLEKSNTLFWQGRALDVLLQFHEAAKVYESSFVIEQANLDIKKMTYALERASEIYRSLSQEENYVRALSKLYLLKKKTEKNQVKLAQFELTYGNTLFQLKKYNLSQQIFLSAQKRKKLERELLDKILVGLLRSNLFIKNNRDASEKKVNLFISKYIFEKEKTKIEKSREALLSLIKASNLLDENKFEVELKSISQNLNFKNLKNLESIKKSTNRRLNILKNMADKSQGFNETDILYGKMLLQLGDIYSQFFYHKQKRDIYLIKSRQLHTEAKKNLYEALINESMNNQEKLLVSLLLARYTKRDFFIKPDVSIEDSASESALYGAVSEDFIPSLYLVKEGERK